MSKGFPRRREGFLADVFQKDRPEISRHVSREPRTGSALVLRADRA
jgi:hypothetical protein